MAKKKDTVEQEPQVTVADKKKENDALFEQLTNKNKDYMVKLNRKLEDSNMPEDNKILVFNDMLKNIVAEQPNHITARKLYGTVTDQARFLIDNNQGDRSNRSSARKRGKSIWMVHCFLEVCSRLSLEFLMSLVTSKRDWD